MTLQCTTMWRNIFQVRVFLSNMTELSTNFVFIIIMFIGPLLESVILAKISMTPHRAYVLAIIQSLSSRYSAEELSHDVTLYALILVSSQKQGEEILKSVIEIDDIVQCGIRVESHCNNLGESEVRFCFFHFIV